MHSRLFIHFFALLGLLSITLLSSSCRSTPHGIRSGGEITKVKYYRLRPEEDIEASDQMISFEKRHFLYGVGSKLQAAARAGNYYTIFWKVQNNRSPVLVHFDYTQANSGRVARKSLQVNRPQFRNLARFKVIGNEFVSGGDIRAWRVTLEQGGKVIASNRSFLWGN